MRIRPSDEQIRAWAQQWLEIAHSAEVQRLPEAVRSDIFRFIRGGQEASADEGPDVFGVETMIDYIHIMERVLAYVENRPW